MLSFVDELWPEFSIWKFMNCILSYQMGYKTLQVYAKLYDTWDVNFSIQQITKILSTCGVNILSFEAISDQIVGKCSGF